ncbi:MAG: purine-nucleoside phosphorylase [Spirochaetales bacterium]|nr:purine-nucleoside phosphorylase [Spirochaetales bacterium]
MDNAFFKRVENAYRSVERLCPFRPSLGIVAGSGLSGALERIDGREIPFARIKRFPRPTVKGHPGLLKISDRAAMCGGRFHSYEGFSADEVVLPIALLHRLGVRTVVLTNAAGGIRKDLEPGTVALIRDHLNMTGLNPLKGSPPEERGSRFTDMTEAYSGGLRARIRSRYPDLPECVYAGLPGPSYETPAEIAMLEKLGADLVGMSTVLETIAARYLGMNVVGVSLVANRAAGTGGKPLSHADVIAAGGRLSSRMTDFLISLIDLLSEP